MTTSQKYRRFALYVDRRMKLYLVTDSEFESLSTHNGQTTVFYSVGFAVLSAAISVWANAIFYDTVPAPAYVAKWFVAPAGVLIAAVFFYLAYQARRSSTSTWNTIKSESSARANV